jgi:hypothetical protein
MLVNVFVETVLSTHNSSIQTPSGHLYYMFSEHQIGSLSGSTGPAQFVLEDSKKVICLTGRADIATVLVGSEQWKSRRGTEH